MKRIRALEAAGLFLGCMVALAGCGGGGKKIAARVNKDTITEEEFTSRVQQVDALSLGNSAQQGGPARAGDYALQSMITERLIMQLAADKKALPTDAQVTAYVEFAKKYPNIPGSMPRNPFRSDEEMRREARVDVALRGMALGPLNITPQELQKKYDEVKSRLVERERYHLRIFESASNAKAEEALDSLKKGVSFETVALTKSEDPRSRERSGDIGFVNDLQLPPALLAAVRNLKPGEYTQKVVKAALPPTGQPAVEGATPHFFLAQLVEKTPPRTAPMEEVRPLVETLVLQDKDPNAGQRVADQVREYTARADIQVNLKQYEDLVKRLKTAMQPAAPGAPAAPPVGVPAPGAGSPPPAGPTPLVPRTAPPGG